VANLSITNRCNRRCDYCFARESFQTDRIGVADMSWDVFEKSLAFLIRSNIREVSLLGGEPTLHPEFLQFVDRLLDSGLRILVFTGGLVNVRVLERLEQIDEDRLSVLVNVVPPDTTNSYLVERQAVLYRHLGSRIVLGMNITSPAVELGFLLDLIDQYELSPYIRLGLAHPVLGGTNHYLHPRHYPEVGRRVTAFGLDALSKGIGIGFDCGWVPCLFPEGGLSAMGMAPSDVGLRCNPIIDVLPDGWSIACYPLVSLSRKYLPNDQDASWLRSRFTRQLAPLRAFHLYKKCASCNWLEEDACMGGCIAAAMRRTRHADVAFSIAACHPTAGNKRVTPGELTLHQVL
jgi:radical SAM protein with 4Fe4S-binding SPASM domain